MNFHKFTRNMHANVLTGKRCHKIFVKLVKVVLIILYHADVSQFSNTYVAELRFNILLFFYTSFASCHIYCHVSY